MSLLPAVMLGEVQAVEAPGRAAWCEEVVKARVQRLPVTEKMLVAGRLAFTAKRHQLDDLYVFYPKDLDEFLKTIYREMAACAAG